MLPELDPVIADTTDELLERLNACNVYRVMGRPLTVTLPLLNAALGTRFESQRGDHFDVDASTLRRSRMLRRLLHDAVKALRRARQDPVIAAAAGLKLRFARHYSVELARLCNGAWSLTLDFASA